MTTMMAPTETLPLAPDMRVHFPSGIPGFEEYTCWTLLSMDGAPVYWLQCAEEPAIAIPVADAFMVDRTYNIDLDKADVRALRLRRPQDALVLVVLTVPLNGGEITANLLAPILVNRESGFARQIIRDGSSYPLRYPVLLD